MELDFDVLKQQKIFTGCFCLTAANVRHFQIRVLGDIRVETPQKLDFVVLQSLNLDGVVFQSWNLNIVAFCLRKKSLVIVMSWPIFSVSQCHGVLDPESRSRSFLVLESRYCVLFGLGISMLWYMHLHSLLFVFIVKIDYFNIVLKNISIIRIYATAICIMYS